MGTGLLTLEITPEPESMPGSTESAGEERAEQPRRLSTIGEEAEEHLELVRGEARRTDELEGRTSPEDQAADPQPGDPTSLEKQEGEPTALLKRSFLESRTHTSCGI
jgi:hypothetical protein